MCVVETSVVHKHVFLSVIFPRYSDKSVVFEARLVYIMSRAAVTLRHDIDFCSFRKANLF